MTLPLATLDFDELFIPERKEDDNAPLLKLIEEDFNILNAYFKGLDRINDNKATEGIITKIVLNITDIIGRIINNLKSMILNIFKSLDRSELRAYVDSNRASIAVILRKDYSDISGLKVAAFPFTMDKLQMIDTISSYFFKMSMDKRIKDINKSLLNIYEKMLNKKALTTELKDLKALLINDEASEVFTLIKEFTDTDNIISKFGDMFKSMNEFKIYYNKVLNSSGEIDKAIKLSNILEKQTYPILDRYNRSLTKDESLVESFKKSGKEFAKEVYNLGYLIDAYGHLVKHYHHVEHNLVNILKKLMKTR